MWVFREGQGKEKHTIVWNLSPHSPALKVKRNIFIKQGPSTSRRQKRSLKESCRQKSLGSWGWKGGGGTGAELVSDRQTTRDSPRRSRTVETTQQEDRSKTLLILLISRIGMWWKYFTKTRSPYDSDCCLLSVKWDISQRDWHGGYNYCVQWQESEFWKPVKLERGVGCSQTVKGSDQ